MFSFVQFPYGRGSLFTYMYKYNMCIRQAQSVDNLRTGMQCFTQQTNEKAANAMKEDLVALLVDGWVIHFGQIFINNCAS